MIRRLIGRWRNLRPIDPWTQLVRNSATSIRDANNATEGIVDRAGGLAEKVSAGEEPVALLSPREAEDKWEEILSGVERELRRMCGLYDYRELLFVSRLCSGVPALRERDPEMEATKVRSQNADRWILRCAERHLAQDYLRLEEDRSFVGELPAAIFPRHYKTARAGRLTHLIEHNAHDVQLYAPGLLGEWDTSRTPTAS